MKEIFSSKKVTKLVGQCNNCNKSQVLESEKDVMKYWLKHQGHTVNIGSIKNKLKPIERLKKIAEIIECVDNRCLAVDGPVSPTLSEMTQKEISEIYKLAKGDQK